jgi:hypothetical protein
MKRITIIAEVEIDETAMDTVGAAMPTDLRPDLSPSHNEIGELVRCHVRSLIRGVDYVKRVEVIYLPILLK